MKIYALLSSALVVSSLYAATPNADKYKLTNEQIEDVKKAIKEFENIQTLDDLKKLQEGTNLSDVVSKDMSEAAISKTSSNIDNKEIEELSSGKGFEKDKALDGIKLDTSDDDLLKLSSGKGFENDKSLEGVEIDMSDEALKELANSFTGNVEEIAEGKIDEATPDEIKQMFKETEVTDKDRKRYDDAVAEISDEDIQAIKDDTKANEHKYGAFQAKGRKDELQGLEKLACEAILCLASGTGIAECGPSLTKYFSIVFRKPWKTIAARKNFLQLCPKDNNMGAQNAANMESLLDVLSHMEGKCDKETLNGYLDHIHITPTYYDRDCIEEYGYTKCNEGLKLVRVKPSKPHYCTALGNHAFGLDQRDVKYTCNANAYYTERDWNRGYYFEEVSKAEYDKLPDNLKGNPRNAWGNASVCIRSHENECRASYSYPAFFIGDWIKTGLREYKAMEYPVCTKKFGIKRCFEWDYRTTKHYKKVFINKNCWNYVGRDKKK